MKLDHAHNMLIWTMFYSVAVELLYTYQVSTSVS